MLLETVFRSEDLPARERLAALDGIWVDSAHPMHAASDTPQELRATLRMLELAAVNVAEVTLSSCQVLRTPRLIRRADPELCSVIVPVAGTLVLSQAGRETVLDAQHLALYDSSQPFRIQFAADGAAARAVRAHIPRALLGCRLPSDGLGRLLARPLPARTGFGGLLARFLADLSADAAGYRPHDLPRLGLLAQDLLTSVVAHHLDADDPLPDGPRHRTLLLSIETFIRQHLGDPQLSPETVAAAHHVSTSHLHRLFRTRETTVAAWIRQQRLEHARRDLTDPALRDVPIHQIAARWGFKDHATFTRAFRSAYGAAPKDYRLGPAPGLFPGSRTAMA